MASASLLALPDEILVRIIRLLDLYTILSTTRRVCGKLRSFSIKYGKKVELDLHSDNYDIAIREGKSRPNRPGLKDFKTLKLRTAVKYVSGLPEFFAITSATLKLSSSQPSGLCQEHIGTSALCQLAQDHQKYFRVDSLTLHCGFETTSENLFQELKLAITTFSKQKLKNFVLLANFSSRHLRYLLDLTLANDVHISSFFTVLPTKTDLQYLMDHILLHNVKAVAKEFNLFVKVDEEMKSTEIEAVLQQFTQGVANCPIFMKSCYLTSDLQTSQEGARMAPYRLQNRFYPSVVNRYLGYKIDITNTKEAFIVVPTQQFPSFSVALATIGHDSPCEKSCITITARREIVLKVSFEPLNVDYRCDSYRIPRGETLRIGFEEISRSGYIDYDMFPDFLDTQKIVITYGDCEALEEHEFPTKEKWLEFEPREEPQFVTELSNNLPFKLAIE